MAELRPYPFASLLTRMFRELESEQKILDLPLRSCFFGDPERDLSVSVHGHLASSPLGPAAGPQSQMAQNIVLCWLGGSRVMELKTVQLRDELELPRPCIDMRTVGYNVEWSQELKLEQSLEEYVKGAMAVEILRASGKLPLQPGFDRTVFDMSVGYDLAGIQSERVSAFLEGMMDATAVVERLRKQIPQELARFRDLDFQTRLSDTLTLSTFHGCPPEEIERIVLHLLERHRLHCVVKLNPTLLGPQRVRALLNDQMGYHDIAVPDSAFERDARWDQVVPFVDRLGERASGLGLGLGVKFSNTLLVENRGDFFPSSEKEMYLSGPPLHVLAMNLVQDFRAHFGARFPISFSAGIDRSNFADAVALGLAPVTVCTDLLKPGGYSRSARYFDSLAARMQKVGARSVPELVIRGFGQGQAALARLELEPAARAACERALEEGLELAEAAGPAVLGRWASEAALLNTARYVPLASADPRYARAQNAKPPRKLGSRLELFDCVTCNKCIPVCPNDANFAFVLPKLDQPIVKLHREDAGWSWRVEGNLTVSQKQQYGNFADLCNECGNCDVFCPEDGGPYVVKPRFFGSVEDWRSFAKLDGFALERPATGPDRLWGRLGGREYSLQELKGRACYTGPGFELALDPDQPSGAVEGTSEGDVDLTPLYILRWVRAAVFGQGQINYLNTLHGEERDGDQRAAS